MELLKEMATRERKAARQRSASGNPNVGSGGQRANKFNMNTYKFHAMGDYLQSIRLFGTTDSFTTQIGELAHRALKAFYPLTSKLDTLAQLAKHERRCRVLQRVSQRAHTSLSIGEQGPVDPPAAFKDHHYILTLSRNNPLDIFSFLRGHNNDPAVSAFIPKLKNHILYRLRKLDVTYCDHLFTDEERNSVIIADNRLYTVQTMQVHYTTYDLRREYDTISPRMHCDIMVLSGETRPQHPYWYARVLGIYYLDVWLNVEGPVKKRQMEVLYIRWLAPVTGHRSGMNYARLPKVAFVEESDYDAFGFLDPGQVIWGAHLIPASVSGRGTTSLRHGKSFARQDDMLDDWEVYYVGIFVDRDMFMQYTPYGIGHPTVLREMTRDCANSNLANSPESEDNGDDAEGDSEKGGREAGREEGDEGDEVSDEEECEDDDSIVDPDDEGMEDGEDSVDEEDNLLSF